MSFYLKSTQVEVGNNVMEEMNILFPTLCLYFIGADNKTRNTTQC